MARTLKAVPDGDEYPAEQGTIGSIPNEPGNGLPSHDEIRMAANEMVAWNEKRAALNAQISGFRTLPSLSPAERDDLREKHRVVGQAAIKSAGRKIVDSPNARPFLEARGGCKWPIDTDGGMHMCCNPITRGSYCTGHAAIAYTGIPQRQNLTNGKAAAFLARNDGVERVRKPKADNDSLWDDVRAA